MARIPYIVMLPISEQVRLIEQNMYTLYVRHLQVIVKSYGHHTNLPKTLKYSRPEYYAKATLSSQVLCCKHYISTYLVEHLTKKK